jgi:hypothetical protein
VEIIANFRVDLFPRSVRTHLFDLYLPGSGKRQEWVYLSSEQGVFNELGFKIVIMPTFEPTWILLDCSFEKSGNFNLKVIGYLQKPCKRAKSC